jgi:hypothetical protein
MRKTRANTNRASGAWRLAIVAAVDPDLVIRDREGQVNSVRYEAVNAMLGQ